MKGDRRKGNQGGQEEGSHTTSACIVKCGRGKISLFSEPLLPLENDIGAWRVHNVHLLPRE